MTTYSEIKVLWGRFAFHSQIFAECPVVGSNSAERPAKGFFLSLGCPLGDVSVCALMHGCEPAVCRCFNFTRLTEPADGADGELNSASTVSDF